MSADTWIESLILSESGEHALTWGLMSITFILLPTRLYLRYTRYHRLLSDDHLLFPAFVLMISLGAIHTYQYPILFLAHHYFTTETPFPPDFLANEIPSLRKTQFAKTFLVWTLLWFCKLSLLMFLRRLLRVWPAYMRWWWVVMGMCTAAWGAVVLINCFTCFPPKRKWEGNSCDNPHDNSANNNGLIAASVLDITSDIAIILLPYRLLLCLKIRLRHKLIISCVFSLSIFLIFLAVFRIILLYKGRETHSAWLNGIASAQFGQIFGTTSVILAILPALRLFFTEEQRRGWTQDVERMQEDKKKGKGVGESGDATVFSTTWVPEEGEQISQGDKVTGDSETTIDNDRTTTGEGSNVVRRLSSLTNLGRFMRCESNHKIVAPFPEPDVYVLENNGGQGGRNSAHALSMGVPPLQVKLHQVIPDIGGETSPVIRKR
ncbi:uncharacterized protein DFL_002346 [Arthrobotrys flagrans]|uniref:Rhodopsin domain-containing protein n=1 Tax=Arthrobotrys flagrans TaxID=97331 RepID=A0A437AAK2_ARTFL|nr:hypothetical protein DFL_002346 [Arthrobotrys flagrans]